MSQYMQVLHRQVLAFWYKKSGLAYLLVPFSWLFRFLCFVRYHYQIKRQRRFSVPIIIVGNISLGGTGKTPLVMWLVNQLAKKNFKVAVIMRGYRAHNQQPTLVKKSDEALDKGDEPLLLARKINSPVVIGKDRVQAINYLLQQFPKTNLIICDDGLQHYKLARDVEIALIDGIRRLGNGFCLPAGPLRESPKRLNQVDFIVTNGKALNNEWQMQTQFSENIYSVTDPKKVEPLASFAGKRVHAVAAIGHPERFFLMLKEKNIEVIKHAFPDHYYFKKEDLLFEEKLPILMTEKDSVKCQNIAPPNSWWVGLQISLPELFIEKLLEKIPHG